MESFKEQWINKHERIKALARNRSSLTRNDIHDIFNNSDLLTDYNNQLKYNLIQSQSNTPNRIAYYMINQLTPITNYYSFNRKQLAQKFNCSVFTVNRGIKEIKRWKFYKVYNNHISINYKKYQNLKKEGVIDD